MSFIREREMSIVKGGRAPMNLFPPEALLRVIAVYKTRASGKEDELLAVEAFFSLALLLLGSGCYLVVREGCGWIAADFFLDKQ